jgi:hypothetical protein
MTESIPRNAPSIGQLILVPSIITLAITIIRLVGELQGWSEVFFNKSAGGFGSLIGITWLAPIFGVYFALKLARADQAPASAGKAIGYAALGLVLIFGSLAFFAATPEFTGKGLVILLILVASAAVPFSGWSALSKVMLAYGYAARIPVAILMYFAIRGEWGTHYDVRPPNFPPDQGFWSTYFQIGFMPQMIGWIAFTIAIGALAGGITAAVAGRSKAAEHAHA